MKEWPGVSLLIAHRNHAGFLTAHLDRILHQDYPLFEIIIIDDHSDASEKEKLLTAIENHANIRVINNDVQGKKNAITTGVHHAQYDRILCSDADCWPVSDQWIKSMVSAGRGNEVIIGYAPLKKETTWLSKLIRFETLFTGIQYLSWANLGRPYMGVGRNLLYPRILFFNVDPFSQSSVPYGDDDLLVQKMSEQARIKTCENPQSFVLSNAPGSLWQWLNQKHRHMSAGHEYSNRAWMMPAVFAIALFFHWLLVIPLAVFSLWWKWLPVFMIGILIRWVNYYIWTRRFGEGDTVTWYPVLEIMYSAYLGLTGLFTSIIKKRSWN